MGDDVSLLTTGISDPDTDDDAAGAAVEKDASKTNGSGNSNNPANINLSALNIQEAKKNLDKPLLRRKSDLPTDILTQNSLESYKRADEFLTTPGNEASSDS